MDQQLCWWCCHSWEGEVLHLPFKYCTKLKQLKTMGNFCSWNCMKAFNMDKHTDAKMGAINSLILKSIKDSTGKMILNLKKAPDRYTLRAFGGIYSIDEFRNTTDIGVQIVNYPDQIHRIHTVTETNRLTFRPSTTGEIENKLKNIERSNGSNETLKLKRPTPLKREMNNLELSMGITRVSKQN